MRLNKRKPCKELTDTNVSVITLADAVKRYTETGQFNLSDSSSGSFESDTTDIDPKNEIEQSVSKIESSLKGTGFIRELKAAELAPETPPETPPVTPPETPPAE